MKRGRVLLLIISILVATASFSNAEAITFNLAEVLSGDTPIRNINSDPFLTATFLDIVPPTNSGFFSQVQLTLGAANLTGNTQFISQFFFNVDPSIFTGPPLTFSWVSGPEATDIGVSSTGINAGPDGPFNIDFEFATSNSPTSDRFQAGESVVYDILSKGLISANSFNLANTSGYLSIAHVQGIPLLGGNEGSSWIVASPTAAPVPEPSTMLLLGIGLTCVAFFGRKRF